MPATAAQTTTKPTVPVGQGGHGEAAASNVRPETALAVRAPDQFTASPRLRDQETAERSERELTDKKTPTGPPPAFKESPLERQARVALDPPDVAPEPEDEVEASPIDETDSAQSADTAVSCDAGDIDQPPTPRERAEVSFSETKAIAEPVETASINVSA